MPVAAAAALGVYSLLVVADVASSAATHGFDSRYAHVSRGSPRAVLVEVEAVLALGPAQRLGCNSRLPDQ